MLHLRAARNTLDCSQHGFGNFDEAVFLCHGSISTQSLVNFDLYVAESHMVRVCVINFIDSNVQTDSHEEAGRLGRSHPWPESKLLESRTSRSVSMQSLLDLSL
jgi:hypothetical protein